MARIQSRLGGLPTSAKSTNAAVSRTTWPPEPEPPLPPTWSWTRTFSPIAPRPPSHLICPMLPNTIGPSARIRSAPPPPPPAPPFSSLAGVQFGVGNRFAGSALPPPPPPYPPHRLGSSPRIRSTTLPVDPTAFDPKKSLSPIVSTKGPDERSPPAGGWLFGGIAPVARSAPGLPSWAPALREKRPPAPPPGRRAS